MSSQLHLNSKHLTYRWFKYFYAIYAMLDKMVFGTQCDINTDKSCLWHLPWVIASSTLRSFPIGTTYNDRTVVAEILTLKKFHT